jgi:DnaK suppressor protein
MAGSKAAAKAAKELSDAEEATPVRDPKKSKPMPKKQLAHFEKRLLEERKRVMKELGHHGDTFGPNGETDGDTSAYSFHMADQGTDAMEREKAFLFASQEGRFLWHIDQALRRLYKSPETFGKCHQCGNDLAFERLDALPHARFCIACKQREEDSKKS